jgi:hypothetical protein
LKINYQKAGFSKSQLFLCFKHRFSIIFVFNKYQTMNKNHWIVQGLFHGIIMFLGIAVLIPLICGDKLTSIGLAKNLGFWLIAGFVYALLLKLYRKN